jgi:integrase
VKFTVGWKTFRHSYRSWLDQTEAPIGVQRELMRHASIQTTMNVYGRVMTDSKRLAHENVVQMVLQVKTAEAAVAEDPKPKAKVV